MPEECSTQSGCSNGSCSKVEPGVAALAMILGPGVGALERRVPVEVGQEHRVLECRQPRPDLRHGAEPVVVPAAVAVAVDGEQHLRLELGEAVDDGPDPEVRGARRPDRADARAGEKRGDGLLDVREVGDDPIAGADPE